MFFKIIVFLSHEENQRFFLFDETILYALINGKNH